jgi:N-acetylmuramoyl-L-alanine amidase
VSGIRIVRILIALSFLSLLSLPRLKAQAPTIEVYDLRFYSHPTHTRIVVDVGGQRNFTSAELKTPDRLYIDIDMARLNPILHAKSFSAKGDYLKEIRIAQRTPTTVRVVAELDFAKIERYQIFPLFDPFRIVIDIFPKEAEAPPEQASPGEAKEKPPQPARPTTSGYSMARQLGLGVKTIVLDPGHGGEDPGAISRKGQKEKDVTLAVAKELRSLLSAKGLNVVLTRESDIYIPLENRTVIANQKKADLFISIHANAHRNRKRKGIETFYLNFSPDLRVNEIAAQENATSTKTIGEMSATLQKIVQNSKILESHDLAEKIQQNLVKYLSQKHGPVESLGVKGGPFWVLIGGEMPSVLVEISHLSNSEEEARLRSPAFRKQVAQGICEGIVEYMRSLGKG